MSKSWSEVIENIDLSTKPLREPRKLSCDEITDLKEKCNPKYDLTILDLICTIEALQQENEQLRSQLDEWKYEVKCHMDEVIAREKQMAKMADTEIECKEYEESEGEERIKPDGVSDNVYNDLINALEKAILRQDYFRKN